MSEQEAAQELSSYQKDSGLRNANDDEAEEREEEENERPNCCYRALLHSRCGPCMLNWPRSCAVFLGVILPLFLLIFLSLIFGSFLANAEAPNEVNQNDALLAGQNATQTATDIVGNFTAWIPLICLELYIQNSTIENLPDSIDQVYESTRRLNSTRTIPDSFSGLLDRNVNINTTELAVFMRECGLAAEPIIDNHLDQLENATAEVSGDLTFNWIRCFPGAQGLDRGGIFDYVPNHNELFRPAAQEEYFVQTWQSDLQEHYERFYNESMADGMGNLTAKVSAYAKALQEASGGSGCQLNGAGSGWFWFTIMTTVGYGNQAPTTTAGKTMVYTLGFVSLLAFAGVLATSGHILSKLAEDIAHRSRLHFFAKPWYSCIFWGIIFYAWMLITASLAVLWKEERLGDYSFSLRDGYWFSYITSTTVGLGDIYLEPEVFVSSDLIVFPLLFLLGFVYLAAFFGHCKELYFYVLGRGETDSVVDALVARFPQVGCFAKAKENMHGSSDQAEDQNGDVEVARPQESRYYDAQEEFEDAQSTDGRVNIEQRE